MTWFQLGTSQTEGGIGCRKAMKNIGVMIFFSHGKNKRFFFLFFGKMFFFLLLTNDYCFYGHLTIKF